MLVLERFQDPRPISLTSAFQQRPKRNRTRTGATPPPAAAVLETPADGPYTSPVLAALCLAALASAAVSQDRLSGRLKAPDDPEADLSGYVVWIEAAGKLPP